MTSVLLAGIGFGLFLAISVGPPLFAIIRYSVGFGWRAGISFVLGVALSDFLYVFIANLASDFLSGLMSHQKIIGLLGSAVFILFGLIGFLKKIKVSRHKSDDANVTSGEYRKIFFSGFALNTFNPGVIVTWITAVAAISNFSTTHRWVFFSACLGLILSIDFLKVFMAQKIRKKLTPRNIVYLNRISALCIVGIGIFIAIKTLFNIKTGGY
jgi:Putative threonine efflux protein